VEEVGFIDGIYRAHLKAPIGPSQSLTFVRYLVKLQLEKPKFAVALNKRIVAGFVLTMLSRHVSR
jgi:hypothetical protein